MISRLQFIAQLRILLKVLDSTGNLERVYSTTDSAARKKLKEIATLNSKDDPFCMALKSVEYSLDIVNGYLYVWVTSENFESAEFSCLERITLACNSDNLCC